ncbi:hypothetical protein QTP70_002635 [Hemibagrus guttatus]|uniref:Ig-like domain-containing protein n=1 Tax=Hemibagrus guttatus TaxID=175788 RepID=A0AAE0V2U1_9TELE|nr:hypothetical protein QTP70_002635 [Hemibagrus guttatus]
MKIITYKFSPVLEYYVYAAGLSDCVQIKQPSNLIANLTDNVKISCTHDDNNFDIMLWYQQRRQSTALALISYNYGKGTPNYETGYSTRFTHNRINTVTGDLTISNLSLSDSAVYYCSARLHSASVSSPA